MQLTTLSMTVVDTLGTRLHSRRNLQMLFLLDLLQWARSILEGQRLIKIILLSLQYY